MHNENHVYYDDGQKLVGYLAFDEENKDSRPAVLVAPDWSGRNDFVCDKAKQLAEMGYVGLAMDVYGDGVVAQTIEDKKALMSPFMSDRQLLRQRLQASYDALIRIPEVDPTQVAIIGFCFGGLCALDLARSGMALKGAVSFHGLLNPPEQVEDHSIQAKVLVLHGYDDPMVSPQQVNDFCHEMTASKVDWQVHMYGHTKHAFTNPEANNADLGTIFNEVAANRSWQAMTNFLSEIFE